MLSARLHRWPLLLATAITFSLTAIQAAEPETESDRGPSPSSSTSDAVGAAASDIVVARRRRKRKKKKPPPPLPKPDPKPAPAPAPEPEPLQAPDPIAPAEIASEIESETIEASTQPELAGDKTEEEGFTEEEEFVDFEEEERASDEQSRQMIAAAGGETKGGGAGGGIKLFIDLLVDYRVGTDTFEFRPNHTYVLVSASITENSQILIHASDNPIFFEFTYNFTPDLSITLGKILVPFGTNEFHHIIGGRVDDRSNFLPQTWGDYGVSLRHLALDTEWMSLEYNLYLVNGFSGGEEPNIGDGSPTDNNWWKGIGTRLKLTLFNKILATVSAYHDVWNDIREPPDPSPIGARQVFYYALGLELRSGLFRNIPVLNRLRIRGEYGRGEIQTATGNSQSGILPRFAYARTGYYIELTARIWKDIAFRLRMGRVNSDNRFTDAGDVEVYEPAILFGTGTKIMWTIAYQFTGQPTKTRPMFNYNPENPADVLYGKVFIQY